MFGETSQPKDEGCREALGCWNTCCNYTQQIETAMNNNNKQNLPGGSGEIRINSPLISPHSGVILRPQGLTADR